MTMNYQKPQMKIIKKLMNKKKKKKCLQDLKIKIAIP